METIKKMAARVLLMAAIAPVMLAFNCNADKVWLNLVGIAWLWLLRRYGRRIAPRFVLDVLDKE